MSTIDNHHTWMSTVGIGDGDIINSYFTVNIISYNSFKNHTEAIGCGWHTDGCLLPAHSLVICQDHHKRCLVSSLFSVKSVYQNNIVSDLFIKNV